MGTVDPDVIAQHLRTDGTLTVVEKGDRWIMRIDSENDFLEIDPEVVMEGDPSCGFRLTAPFTTAEVRWGVASSIYCRDLRITVDLPALLSHAHETGSRRLRLSDFARPTPA